MEILKKSKFKYFKKSKLERTRIIPVKIWGGGKKGNRRRVTRERERIRKIQVGGKGYCRNYRKIWSNERRTNRG